MPIVKQSKKLDGSNSIYRASRKVAARQLKNMKGIALDTGETDVQSPIPTVYNSPDTEGLVPKLLQNVSDVNGLLTSLKMVGEADGKPKKGSGRRLRKSLCGGARTPSQVQREIEREIVGMDKRESEIQELSRQIHENRKINPTSAEELASKQKTERNLKARIATRNKANDEAAERIKVLEEEKLRAEEEEDEGGKEGVPNDREISESLDGTMTSIRMILIGVWRDINRGIKVPKDTRDRLHELVDNANAYREALNIPPSLSLLKYKLYNEDELVFGDPDDEYEGDTQSQITIPVEEFEEDDLPFEDAQEGDREDAEEGELPEIDFDLGLESQYNFSRVNKSTLLVILNQLKSLVKAGEIILKKIVHKNVMASESDLNDLTDEVADMIYLKRFLYSHIDQIIRRSKDLGEYLRRILSGLLGKYIEALKIYIKRYAQLNIQQINRLQEGVREAVVDVGDEIPEPEVIGAGRKGLPVVLSDAVRRISKFDRKYIL